MAKVPVPQIEQTRSEATTAEQAPAATRESMEDKAAETSKVKATVDTKPAEEAPLQEDEGAADDPYSPKSLVDALHGIRELFSEMFRGHGFAVIGGAIGLVIAVLIFTIGFWQTMFVSLLVVTGVALGQYLDGDPKIINLIRRLIDELRGSNN